MAIAKDLVRVSQEAEPVVDPPAGGDVGTIIPVYIMHVWSGIPVPKRVRE
jgi:hypothetical protein